MAKYILTTERMRIVQRNERGNVTFRKRYSKGDEVNPDHLEEGRLEALLESGALVEDSEADEVSEQSNQSAPNLDPETDDEDEDDTDEDDDSSTGPDRYDDMSYADLQAESKSRTGDGSGGAEALKARLRQQDEFDNDDA